MAIMYVMAFWNEEDTEYIGMDKEGTLFWTPFLDSALLIEQPKGRIPDHCNWLPVFVPNIHK
jgi:hypothetical protein